MELPSDRKINVGLISEEPARLSGWTDDANEQLAVVDTRYPEQIKRIMNL